METQPKSSSHKLLGASLVSLAVLGGLFALPSQIHDLGQPDFPTPREASFLVVGDIMLGRNVELLSKDNPNYPFEKIRKFLESYETVVANLEGPIPETHTRTLSGSFSFSFPPNSAQTLSSNNIEYVSLANNHGLDQGSSGLLNTQNILSEVGITAVGHPSAIDQESVKTARIGNVSISIFAFNQTWETFNLSRAVELIQTTKDTDYKIVLIHWGDEYQLTSNDTQQQIGRAFIDAGADAIFGAHPHVVQEIEVYRGKPIFYSLGNFIFDQYFSRNTQEGLLVQVDMVDENITYTLWPLTSTKSQPVLMEENSKKEFLNKLAARSDTRVYNDIAEGILVTPLEH